MRSRQRTGYIRRTRTTQQYIVYIVIQSRGACMRLLRVVYTHAEGCAITRTRFTCVCHDAEPPHYFASNRALAVVQDTEGSCERRRVNSLFWSGVRARTRLCLCLLYRVLLFCAIVVAYALLSSNYPSAARAGMPRSSQPAICCPRLWVAWCVRARRSPVVRLPAHQIECTAVFRRIRFYSVCDCRHRPCLFNLLAMVTITNVGKNAFVFLSRKMS